MFQFFTSVQEFVVHTSDETVPFALVKTNTTADDGSISTTTPTPHVALDEVPQLSAEPTRRYHHRGSIPAVGVVPTDLQISSMHSIEPNDSNDSGNGTMADPLESRADAVKRNDLDGAELGNRPSNRLTAANVKGSSEALCPHPHPHSYAERPPILLNGYPGDEILRKQLEEAVTEASHRMASPVPATSISNISGPDPLSQLKQQQHGLNSSLSKSVFSAEDSSSTTHSHSEQIEIVSVPVAISIHQNEKNPSIVHHTEVHALLSDLACSTDPSEPAPASPSNSAATSPINSSTAANSTAKDHHPSYSLVISSSGRALPIPGSSFGSLDITKSSRFSHDDSLSGDSGSDLSTSTSSHHDADADADAVIAETDLNDLTPYRPRRGRIRSRLVANVTESNAAIPGTRFSVGPDSYRQHGGAGSGGNIGTPMGTWSLTHEGLDIKSRIPNTRPVLRRRTTVHSEGYDGSQHNLDKIGAQQPEHEDFQSRGNIFLQQHNSHESGFIDEQQLSYMRSGEAKQTSPEAYDARGLVTPSPLWSASSSHGDFIRSQDESVPLLSVPQTNLCYAWQGAMERFMAEKKSRIIDVFRRFDADGDGNVCRADMGRGLERTGGIFTSAEADALFDILASRRHTELLDYSDFAAYLHYRHPLVPRVPVNVGSVLRKGRESMNGNSRGHGNGSGGGGASISSRPNLTSQSSMAITPEALLEASSRLRRVVSL